MSLDRKLTAGRSFKGMPVVHTNALRADCWLLFRRLQASVLFCRRCQLSRCAQHDDNPFVRAICKEQVCLHVKSQTVHGLALQVGASTAATAAAARGSIELQGEPQRVLRISLLDTPLEGRELEQISIHAGQQEAVHHHIPTLATIEEQHSRHLEPPVSSLQVRSCGALLCCWACQFKICDVAGSLYPLLIRPSSSAI